MTPDRIVRSSHDTYELFLLYFYIAQSRKRFWTTSSSSRAQFLLCAPSIDTETEINFVSLRVDDEIRKKKTPAGETSTLHWIS